MKAAVEDVATQGLRRTFEDRILPAARRLSPRSQNLKPGQRVHNADSIKVKITSTQKGPKARIFTTSGHGYYLEVGTSKMPARPFLRPAYDSNIGNLVGDMKEVAVAKYK